ncbi:MAG: hypothetical protein RBT61_04380 [Candidatus Kapabacteria bacterium]|nr:hypothetical protein [Candidatus Kapabacteria bacterium]
MKISFFLIVFFLTFQRNNSTEMLEITKVNKSENGIDLDFKIVNNSNIDYYYIFNESQVSFIDNLSKIESFGLNIEITNSQNDKVLNYIGYPYLNPKEMNKAIKNEEKINPFRLVVKNGKEKALKINTSKYYTIQHLKNQLQYKELLNISDSLFVRIIYKQDSVKVKSLIKAQKYDSLVKNNIKIFHGTISSNKVPLKLKQ